MRLALAAALAAIPLVAVPLVVPAVADPLEDAIKARRGYFTLLGANIGPLAAMAKGEVDYDAEVAALHAANLGQLAGYNPLPHFPGGTDNEAFFGDTRALPAIWADLEGFGAAQAEFVKAAQAMSGPAAEGRAALGQAVGQLGQTCKACHDDYRAKDF